MIATNQPNTKSAYPFPLAEGYALFFCYPKETSPTALYRYPSDDKDTARLLNDGIVRKHGKLCHSVILSEMETGKPFGGLFKIIPAVAITTKMAAPKTI